MENEKITITKQSELPDVKLEVAGYIAYDTAGEFEKAINDSFQESPESITVDMDKVVVFTSIGIKIILKAYKKAREKRINFQLESPSDVVRNVLKLSDLTELLLK